MARFSFIHSHHLSQGTAHPTRNCVHTHMSEAISEPVSRLGHHCTHTTVLLRTSAWFRLLEAVLLAAARMAAWSARKPNSSSSPENLRIASTMGARQSSVSTSSYLRSARAKDSIDDRPTYWETKSVTKKPLQCIDRARYETHAYNFVVHAQTIEAYQPLQPLKL